MMKFINNVKEYLMGSDRENEEFRKALWEHEQIGYKIYSIEVAIEKLKREA